MALAAFLLEAWPEEPSWLVIAWTGSIGYIATYIGGWIVVPLTDRIILGPVVGNSLTSEQAIAIAKDVARENAWPWIGEGHVRRAGYLSRLVHAGGEHVWSVVSHRDRGCNVYVIIRDRDGRVLAKGFAPR